MTIKLNNVSHTYAMNSPFEYHALNNVSLTIPLGGVSAIVGATGSGKSTLVQHLNGLLKPTGGSLTVLDTTIAADTKVKGLKALRSKVGLVFQFPEMQLFEETVYADVAFGPKNFGFTEAETKKQVETALEMVGIDASLWERSPFELSGGQKRRVAIAGVLATNPEVLILDEPTAGLDPQGSKDMMALFMTLNKDYNKTIIMVTHDMDHVLYYSDTVFVMEKGTLSYEGTSQEFFKNREQLLAMGFVEPKIMQLKHMLAEKGIETHDSIDLKEIAQIVKKEGKRHG